MNRLILILLLAFAPLPVMAQGVPIGALPQASLPLTGSELMALSQNGAAVRATVTQVNTAALAPIANNTVLGNVSGSTAAPVAVNASQLATLLGLGTAAFQNTGSSGQTIPFLNGVNTWSGLQTFAGGAAISGTVTVGNLNVTGTSTLGSGTASPLVVTGTGISANIASGAGTIELLPSNGTVNITSALSVSATSSTAATTTTTLTATGAVALSPANANVVLSPTGTGVVTINPATAGTVNNVAIGGSTPRAGTFTALTATGAVALSPANANVVISPTGTGLVTINPATAGTLNNVVIGGSTPLAITGTTITANTAFRGTDVGTGSATALSLTTTGGTQAKITNTASAANYVNITGAASSGAPVISVDGSDANQTLKVQGKGTSPVDLGATANGTGFRASADAGSVNFFDVHGTSSVAYLTTAGSSSAINMHIFPKGTGSIIKFGANGNSPNSGNIDFQVTGGTTSINYLQATGGGSGTSPTLAAIGTGTDLDIRLTPKGAGYVNVTATGIKFPDSTTQTTAATGGLALSAVQAAANSF